MWSVKHSEKCQVYNALKTIKWKGVQWKSRTFSSWTICVNFPRALSWALRVELFIPSLSSRVLYRLCSVLYSILLKTHWLNVNWTLLKLYKVFCSSFHLWCSVIMEDSADIELYEEIVGNPAYSSSSDTSKSDPVSFQFKEPRQTECREEDFFARARSPPDPRIISHALAGKKYSRAAILPASVELLEWSFTTIVQFWGCDVQTLPHLTSLRYWRPTWGPLMKFPYSTTLRHYYSAIYNHSLRNLNWRLLWQAGVKRKCYHSTNQSQFYVSFPEKLLKFVAILGYIFCLQFTK